MTDAVGFDVPKNRVEYRLAVFADYGLFDLHTSGKALALGVVKDNLVVPIEGNIQYDHNTTNMVENIGMYDIMSTDGFANRVSNLMVGVKFTILFQIPEPGQCVICRDAYGSSVGGGSVRRGGVKYEE